MYNKKGEIASPAPGPFCSPICHNGNGDVSLPSMTPSLTIPVVRAYKTFTQYRVD